MPQVAFTRHKTQPKCNYNTSQKKNMECNYKVTVDQRTNNERDNSEIISACKIVDIISLYAKKELYVQQS